MLSPLLLSLDGLGFPFTFRILTTYLASRSSYGHSVSSGPLREE